MSNANGMYGFIAAGRSYLQRQDFTSPHHHLPATLLEEVIDGIATWGDEYGQHVRRLLRGQYALPGPYLYYEEDARRHLRGNRTNHALNTDGFGQPQPSPREYEAFVRSNGTSFNSSQDELLVMPLEYGMPEATDRLARLAAPMPASLEGLLAQPVASRALLADCFAQRYAFVVDLDNDAVAVLHNPSRTTFTVWSDWSIASCASLSSKHELQDMMGDLSDSWGYHNIDMAHFPRYWSEMSRLERAPWLNAFARFQRLGGALLRSFATARCAANLGRPPGWPALVDENAYPADEDVSLLDFRHQFPDERAPWLVEEQRLAANSRGEGADDTLDDLSSDLGTLNAADSGIVSGQPNGVGPLTEQQRKDIMFWKEQNRYSNKWIAKQVGVKEWQVQKLTRGMPGKHRSRRLNQRF